MKNKYIGLGEVVVLALATIITIVCMFIGYNNYFKMETYSGTIVRVMYEDTQAELQIKTSAGEYIRGIKIDKDDCGYRKGDYITVQKNEYWSHIVGNGVRGD